MYDMVIACVFVWFFVGMLFWVLCSLRNEMLGVGGIWILDYKTKQAMHMFTLLFCLLLPPIAILLEVMVVVWNKQGINKNTIGEE